MKCKATDLQSSAAKLKTNRPYKYTIYMQLCKRSGKGVKHFSFAKVVTEIKSLILDLLSIAALCKLYYSTTWNTGSDSTSN